MAWVVGGALLLATCLRPASGARPGPYPQASAEFKVYLKDGTTLTSTVAPLEAFGKLRFRSSSGFLAIPIDQVDRDRSRAQWNRIAPWKYLDTAKHQGRAFPSCVATDRSGKQVTVEPVKGKYTFVEIWSAF